MIPTPDKWHKSSYSNQTGGHCVEVAEMPDVVNVRDTQHRELGHVSFDTAAWTSFLRVMKSNPM